MKLIYERGCPSDNNVRDFLKDFCIKCAKEQFKTENRCDLSWILIRVLNRDENRCDFDLDEMFADFLNNKGFDTERYRLDDYSNDRFRVTLCTRYIEENDVVILSFDIEDVSGIYYDDCYVRYPIKRNLKIPNKMVDDIVETFLEIKKILIQKYI